MIAKKLVLLTSLFDLHVHGGQQFMLPLTILFIVNLGIIVYVVASLMQKRTVQGIWFETIKQIGGLAAAWGTWSTIYGLFNAFDALESSPEVIPFQMICGGLKVASIPVLYGLLIFCISMLSCIILRLTNRSSPA